MKKKKIKWYSAAVAVIAIKFEYLATQKIQYENCNRDGSMRVVQMRTQFKEIRNA